MDLRTARARAADRWELNAFVSMAVVVDDGSGPVVAVKDDLDVAGLPTTVGSPGRRTGPAPGDADVVAALRGHGAGVRRGPQPARRGSCRRWGVERLRRRRGRGPVRLGDRHRHRWPRPPHPSPPGPSTPDGGLSAYVRTVLERGRSIAAVDHLQARHRVVDLREAVEQALHGYDALLLRAVACVAPTHTAAPGLREEMARLVRRFSLTGHPVLCLRAPTPGLPVGNQVVGRYGGDRELVRVAAALERRWVSAPG